MDKDNKVRYKEFGKALAKAIATEAVSHHLAMKFYEPEDGDEEEEWVAEKMLLHPKTKAELEHMIQEDDEELEPAKIMQEERKRRRKLHEP